MNGGREWRGGVEEKRDEGTVRREREEVEERRVEGERVEGKRNGRKK